MYGLLLVGSGQTWPHYAGEHYMANIMYCWYWQQFYDLPYLATIWRWPLRQVSAAVHFTDHSTWKMLMCLTCTSKTSTGKCSMVYFLVDAVVFSFPCQNHPRSFSENWWISMLQPQSTDNLGFDNNIDDWKVKYNFHCSLFSWTSILRPNTLQFHMAAVQGSRVFQLLLSSKAYYLWPMADRNWQVPPQWLPFFCLGLQFKHVGDNRRQIYSTCMWIIHVWMISVGPPA